MLFEDFIKIVSSFIQTHGLFLLCYGLLTLPSSHKRATAPCGQATSIRRLAVVVGLHLLGLLLSPVWRSFIVSQPFLSTTIFLLGFVPGYYLFQEPIASVDKAKGFVFFERHLSSGRLHGVRAYFIDLIRVTAILFGLFVLMSAQSFGGSKNHLVAGLLTISIAALGGEIGYFFWLIQSFLSR